MKKTISITLLILALVLMFTACTSVNEEVPVNPFPVNYKAHGNNYFITGYRINDFEVHVFGNFQKLPMKMIGNSFEILNLMTCVVVTDDGTEYRADVASASQESLKMEFSSSISNAETIRLLNGDSGDEIMSFKVADVPQTSSEPDADSSPASGSEADSLPASGYDSSPASGSDASSVSGSDTSSVSEADLSSTDTGVHYEGSLIGSWECSDNSATGEVWLKIFITPDGRFKFESSDGMEEGTFTLMGNNANIEGSDTEQVVLVKQGILISYPEDGGGESYRRFEIEDDVLTLGDYNYKRVN